MNLTALAVAAVIIGLLLCYAYAMLDKPRQKYTRVEPKPGEVWVFGTTYKGPWPYEGRHKVKIRDVAEGWVRYDMGWMFPDERATVEQFCHMYRPTDGGNA